MGNDREFLGRLDRTGLRRALWLLRRQDARPGELNPAAAQYDKLATRAGVVAEYKRRGWKLPKRTRAEQPGLSSNEGFEYTLTVL
jgi:hypothetical protein